VRIAYDRRDGRIVAISEGFESRGPAIASAIQSLSDAERASFGLVEADQIPENLRAPRPAGRYVYTRPDRNWWMYDPDNHLVDVAWLYDRQRRELAAWQVTSGPQPEGDARFAAHLKARLEGPCRAFLDDPEGIGRGWVLDADDLNQAQLVNLPR
jgi:hypothetical protein